MCCSVLCSDVMWCDVWLLRARPSCTVYTFYATPAVASNASCFLSLSPQSSRLAFFNDYFTALTCPPQKQKPSEDHCSLRTVIPPFSSPKHPTATASLGREGRWGRGYHTEVQHLLPLLSLFVCGGRRLQPPCVFSFLFIVSPAVAAVSVFDAFRASFNKLHI